jgi:hypothetical protein
MTDTSLIERVRGEFREMPGLRLAPVQAARLWSIDAAISMSVLEQLVRDGFLARTGDGAYLRAES